MRAILSKVLIFGSLRGAFFMGGRDGREERDGGGRMKKREGNGREKGRRDSRTGEADNGVRAGWRNLGRQPSGEEVDNLPAALKVFAQGCIMGRNWATILTI